MIEYKLYKSSDGNYISFLKVIVTGENDYEYVLIKLRPPKKKITENILNIMMSIPRNEKYSNLSNPIILFANYATDTEFLSAVNGSSVTYNLVYSYTIIK